MHLVVAGLDVIHRHKTRQAISILGFLCRTYKVDNTNICTNRPRADLLPRDQQLVDDIV